MKLVLGDCSARRLGLAGHGEWESKEVEGEETQLMRARGMGRMGNGCTKRAPQWDKESKGLCGWVLMGEVCLMEDMSGGERETALGAGS